MKWEIGRTLNLSQYGSGKESWSEDLFARGIFIRPNRKHNIKWEQARNTGSMQINSYTLTRSEEELRKQKAINTQGWANEQLNKTQVRNIISNHGDKQT